MTDTHFYGHIREFVLRKAIIAHEEAQAWDTLAKNILLEKHRIEADRRNKPVQPGKTPPEETPALEDKLYVRIKEARQMMGIGNTSIYQEINAGRLPVKKHGKTNLIAVKDIHEWFEALPDK